MTKASRRLRLRREARAWRQLAEWFCLETRTTWLRVQVVISRAMWESMQRRAAAHQKAQVESTPLREQGGVTQNANALAALFLALECEDEAAA